MVAKNYRSGNKKTGANNGGVDGDGVQTTPAAGYVPQDPQLKALLMSSSADIVAPSTDYKGATIGPSPDLTWSDAYYRAQGGYTRFQKIEGFLSTAADITLSKLRKGLAPSVDSSLVNMGVEAVKPLAYMVTGDWGKPGDQQLSENIKDRMLRHYDQGGSKPNVHGQYDIFMAMGWQPKGEIKVNGKITVLDKPIDNMMAVFIRSPNGDVEILDPSVKVQSLPEFFKLLPVYPLLLDGNNPADQRWKESAGTYIATQMAPIALGAGGAAVAKTLSGKSGTFAKATELAGRASSMAGSLQMSSLGYMGYEFYMKRVSEEAANDLAENLVKALKNPAKLTPAVIREALNDGLHDYTFNRNTGEHIYIPSLRAKDEPWTRLSQVMQGRIDGFIKEHNPWDDWKRERDVMIDDMYKKLAENPEFRRAYYKSAEKALSGKPITDAECLVLRVGEGAIAGFEAKLDGQNFSGSKMSYTKEEKDQTVKTLRDNTILALADDIGNHMQLARQMGLDLKKIKDRDYNYMTGLNLHPDDKILADYARDKRQEAEHTILAERNQRVEDRRKGFVPMTPETVAP